MFQPKPDQPVPRKQDHIRRKMQPEKPVLPPRMSYKPPIMYGGYIRPDEYPKILRCDDWK